MSDEVSILITLTNGKELLRVAVRARISEEVLKYSLEPENKKALEELLPSYCKGEFSIVEVEHIFQVIIKA